MRWLPLLLGFLLPLAPEAQVGTCDRGDAEAFVENAGVRASLFNNGALFWRGGDHTYEVPRGSGIQALPFAGIWLGGTVDGEVRFAGSDLGPWEYWPGPLAEDGRPPSDASCEQYDRLWRVTLEDIARYNTTGEATADLAEWPYEAGAPVVDGDGIADNYDLASGDRPAIVGDETVWWIMNDRGNTHDWGERPPIGLEVRAAVSTVSDAYAVRRIGLDRETADALHTATIYRYRLTYRGVAPWEDAFFGVWFFTELGNWRDDYVGSYPEGDVVLIYNADNDDDGPLGYGISPPALGIRMVSGPGPKPLTGFVNYDADGSVTGNPGNGTEAYFYLQSLWRDGSRMTFGGSGYQTGDPTRYMYPDLPPDYWSGPNLDGLGSRRNPGQQRSVLNHGPFRMEPGETTEIVFAIVYSRSESGHFAAARQLALLDAPRVAAVAEVLRSDPALGSLMLADLPAPLAPEAPIPEVPDRYAAAETVWPNPASGESTLRLDLPDAADVRLTVFDALGREVAVPQDGPLAGAEHRLRIQTAGWAPGVYVYRLTVSPEAGGASIEASGRFVVLAP